MLLSHHKLELGSPSALHIDVFHYCRLGNVHTRINNVNPLVEQIQFLERLPSGSGRYIGGATEADKGDVEHCFLFKFTADILS